MIDMKRIEKRRIDSKTDTKIQKIDKRQSEIFKRKEEIQKLLKEPEPFYCSW
jgi:negative regulator of sigma E activity